MTEVDFYLDKARRGENEIAFHGLLELPEDQVVARSEAFQGESDPDLREMIVLVVAGFSFGIFTNQRGPQAGSG